jgi:hypothetical protein
MLQQINNTDLIPGEMYYIKYNFSKHSEKMRMIRYEMWAGRMLAIVEIINPNRSSDLTIVVKYWTYYRYVSEKEYQEKRKEKYDATCLDIVLKRHVDESFSW